MTGMKSKQLDLIFHALADETRRELLLLIAEKECTVTELAGRFDMSLNGISKHLKVLEKAGLLKRTVDGRVHRCVMDAAPLAQAEQVIETYKAFWGRQLDALDEFLTNAKKEDK